MNYSIPTSAIVFPLLFIASCSIKQNNEYKDVCTKLKAVQVDTTKNISFILYNPLGCISCNAIVSNLITETEYTRIFGRNSFVIFPSIRNKEFENIKNDWQINEGNSINYINELALFEYLKTKYPNWADNKPAIIALNKNTDKYVYLCLKDMYVLDSLSNYFPTNE